MQVYGFLEKAQLENVSSDLSNTLLGLVWYNTTDNKMKIYDGAVRAMVTEDGTATLTNKTFSGGTITGAAISGGTLSGIDINLGPATNSNKLVVSSETRANLEALAREAGSVYYSTDEAKYLGDDGLNLIEFGSGSGTGINYTENPDFETNADGHTAYKDSASEIPDDGTGGSPTLTITRSTVSPLVGNASGLITKPASNVQGEGVNVANNDFDEADKGKIHIMSFEYDASDANYNDGDFRVYFKDETNGVVYRVNGEDVKAGKGTHYARVQIPIDCDNGSLLIHCAATHADAVAFKYDRIGFGPQRIVHGTIIEDWQDNGALDIIASTSNPAKGTINYDELTSRRVGDSLEMLANFSQTTAGTNGSGTYYIRLPNGLSGDKTKIQTSSSFIAAVVGHGVISITGGIEIPFQVSLDDVDPTRLVVQIQNNSGSNIQYAHSAWSSSVFSLGNSELHFTASIKVPIVGWSSQAITSEDFGGRDVVVRARGNSGQSITANVTDISFNAVTDEDTTGSWNGTTFTAPETGLYIVTGAVASTTTLSALTSFINGAQQTLIAYEGNLSDLVQFTEIIPLNKGDVFSVRSDSTFTLNALSDRHRIRINKFSSSQQILETERVSARYTSDSGQSIPDSTITTLVYEDKVADTHNAYNPSTGEYTVPTTGEYDIASKMIYTSIAYTAGERIEIFLYVNGVLTEVFDRKDLEATVSSQKMVGGSCLSVPLEKDDVVTCRAFQNTGSLRTLDTAPTYNVFAIERMK